MHIHFLIGVPLEELHEALAQDLLHRHGVDTVSGVIWGRDRLHYLEADGGTWDRLYVASEWMEEVSGETVDLELLKRKEVEYGWPTFHRMIQADRWFNALPYDDALARVQVFIDMVEQAFRDTSPDIVFLDPVADLLSFLHFSIAKSLDIPAYAIDSWRIPDRLSVCNDIYQRWHQVDVIFERMRKTGVPDDARVRAEAFLREFRRDHKQSPGVVARKGVPLSRGRREVEVLIQGAMDWIRDPKNPISQRPHHLIWRRLRRFMKYHWEKIGGRFREPTDEGRYLVYPLHYEPEAATLVLGSYVTDQPALIRNIAQSLPVDHQLFVKEHPVALGTRSSEFYREIESIHNARLIQPFTDRIELIKKSEGVATISGTMGWEAMLLGKPVFTFGNPSYQSYPGVVQLDQLHESGWAQRISETLESFSSDDSLLITYLAAVLTGTYPGTIADSQSYPEVLATENIQRITDALMDYHHNARRWEAEPDDAGRITDWGVPN